MTLTDQRALKLTDQRVLTPTDQRALKLTDQRVLALPDPKRVLKLTENRDGLRRGEKNCNGLTDHGQF